MRAIETVYNGYRFRSRLEARWAVFFNVLGIEYLYEHEGFDLGKSLGWYLPDFWLPDLKCWAEVKSTTFLELEFAKCMKLGNCLLLDSSIPKALRGYVYTDFPERQNYKHYLSDDDYGTVLLEQSQYKKRLWFLFGEPPDAYDLRLSHQAEEAARQARFEHGQVGAPREW